MIFQHPRLTAGHGFQGYSYVMSGVILNYYNTGVKVFRLMTEFPFLEVYHHIEKVYLHIEKVYLHIGNVYLHIENVYLHIENVCLHIENMCLFKTRPKGFRVMSLFEIPT